MMRHVTKSKGITSLLLAAAAIALVTPATALANPTDSPKATGHNVILEVTGSGTVYAIEMDPGGHVADENTSVPFSRGFTAQSGDLLQVVSTVKTGNQGCRITVDGIVVVNQNSESPHCIYTIP
jgi:hypothetical protein